MEVINVTANKLKSLEPLGTMPELKSVYASNNELEQLDFPVSRREPEAYFSLCAY